MGDKSAIQWTNATWNPLVGCSKVSEGCRHCYAIRESHRLAGMGSSKYFGTTKLIDGHPAWTNVVRTVDDALETPLRWRQSRMIFVNSMSDLFHEDVPDAFIDKAFGVMLAAHHHIFQVLTKRAIRMKNYFDGDWQFRVGQQFSNYYRKHTPKVQQPTLFEWDGTMPNVWLGVSVEDQITAAQRIPELICTNARVDVKWISAEPLLERIRLESYGIRNLQWVVVGGESGANSRPTDPEAYRLLRDECRSAGVAFFFKQHGDLIHESQQSSIQSGSLNWKSEMHDGERYYRVGKKQAGDHFDGKQWHQYPAPTDWTYAMLRMIGIDTADLMQSE